MNQDLRQRISVGLVRFLHVLADSQAEPSVVLAVPSMYLRRACALREVSIDDLNGDEGKAMSTETRMAIEQSTPMPQRPESGAVQAIGPVKV